LRSESTRSWSEDGVASRLRLGGTGEDVDSGSTGLALGAVSHGRVRGIVAARVDCGRLFVLIGGAWMFRCWRAAA
jgi:hypothetical protein